MKPLQDVPSNVHPAEQTHLSTPLIDAHLAVAGLASSAAEAAAETAVEAAAHVLMSELMQAFIAEIQYE